MGLEVSVLSIAFFGTGLIILGFLHKPLTRPDTPGSTAFAVTVVGCALWPVSLAVGLSLEGATVSAVAWSGRLVAPTVLSVGWFLLALRIANERTPTRWVVGVLAGYVAFELVLLATNPLHHLGFDPAVVAAEAGMTPDWNAWFWVQAAINYVLMVSATTALALEAIRSTGLRRRQSALLAVAVIPTAFANLLTISGIVGGSSDLSPFGFVGSAAIMSWAIYRAEFLDLVPIARQTALEELPHAVVTLGREGRVVDYNAVARQYFAVEDGTGVPARAFFADFPDDAVDALVSGSANHLQVSVDGDDGERRFDCTASTLGPPGANAGRVLVFNEVSERIHREQRLLEQNETLSEFASIVSHDIQGPLMELRSTATTAVQTNDVGHIEGVLDAADRMDHLVDDLVDLAHSGRHIDDPIPVSLETIAERAWYSVWTPGAELSIDTDLTIEADPDRLQQLLENCFRNAVEHGAGDVVGRELTQLGYGHGNVHDTDSPSPTGTATTQTVPSGVSVTIRAVDGGFAIDDDGPGIDPELRNRVFDRGYTSSPDGTGLGLAIVGQIAAAHDWLLEADESPSGGARFTVTNVRILEE